MSAPTKANGRVASGRAQKAEIKRNEANVPQPRGHPSAPDKFAPLRTELSVAGFVLLQPPVDCAGPIYIVSKWAAS